MVQVIGQPRPFFSVELASPLAGWVAVAGVAFVGAGAVVCAVAGVLLTALVETADGTGPPCLRREIVFVAVEVPAEFFVDAACVLVDTTSATSVDALLFPWLIAPSQSRGVGLLELEAVSAR